MISLWLYSCLQEENFQPSEQHQPDMNQPQNKWKKKDNIAWMELRGVEFAPKITGPEAKELVKRLMAQNSGSGPPIIYDPSVVVGCSEIRDLLCRTFNMFRALFCTDISSTKAKNRSTASVMHFLCLIEDLDVRINPKRAKPIWIAKFNFLSLLRVCESFERFNHVRNMYEGGDLGEGVVKDLRPLVAKGVQAQWATNLLLVYYRHSTLTMLLQAIEQTSSKNKTQNLISHLLESLDESKFKRFGTIADVTHLLTTGKPISLLLFGTVSKWKTGVVVVSQNHWLFCEIIFERGTSTNSDDAFGLTYHEVHLSGHEECLAGDVYPISKVIGQEEYPFWTYGIMLPNFHYQNADNYHSFPYALMRSSWQYLENGYTWNEFSF
jgi:hypothetical protein